MAMPCTNCGNDLADGAAFCAECGRATAASDLLPPPPQPWPMQPPAYPPTPAVLHPPTAYPAIAPTPPTTAEPAASVRNTIGGVLGLLGALALGVASFLAWAQISLAFVDRSQTVSGWDWFDNSVATGPVFAVLALVAAGLSGLVFAQVAPPAVRIVVVAVGALGLGLAVFAVSDILRRQNDLQSVGQVDVSIQAGIWFLLAGAVFILAAGLVATEVRRPATV